MPAGLVFIRWLLRQEPLIAMGFRFRRSTRLGPLRFNFSKGGLSSISVGGRGASFNIPVNRSGGTRSTVGLPGTGLSWSVENTPDRAAVIPAGEAAGLPNSRRLRPGQLDAFKQSLLAVLHKVSADNEVDRSATSSLAGGVSAGEPGADAQGPGDAGTTDQSPTQPVHDETTRWQQPGGCCRSGWHLSAQRPPD